MRSHNASPVNRRYAGRILILTLERAMGRFEPSLLKHPGKARQFQHGTPAYRASAEIVPLVPTHVCSVSFVTTEEIVKQHKSLLRAGFSPDHGWLFEPLALGGLIAAGERFSPLARA
jgi:hypothetical protein